MAGGAESVRSDSNVRPRLRTRTNVLADSFQLLLPPCSVGAAKKRYPAHQSACFPSMIHLPSKRSARGGTWTSNDGQTFDSANFLANAGLGRTNIELKPKETFFCQGEPADSVYYLQKGRARVTVVSQAGKEATITFLSTGDFVGEESLAAIVGLRMATATAVNACAALKISRNEMIRVMHDEPAFTDLFLKFLLTRSMRTQADLVDQLFNSSEKRLARILLLILCPSAQVEHSPRVRKRPASISSRSKPAPRSL